MKHPSPAARKLSDGPLGDKSGVPVPQSVPKQTISMQYVRLMATAHALSHGLAAFSGTPKAIVIGNACAAAVHGMAFAESDKQSPGSTRLGRGHEPRAGHGANVPVEATESEA